MGQRGLRETLLATSSALALVIALDQSAKAACTVVTNHSLPFSFAGNTCASFTATPTGTGDVTSNGTVTASGTVANHSGTGISVYLGSATINGSLINNGTINSSLVGIFMDQTSVTGSIVNSTGATINSASNGILVQGTLAARATEGVHGSITNNGTIIATSNAGIAVNDVTVGTITNTGTITSGLAAIVISEAIVNGNVINSSTGKLVATAFTAGLSVSNGGTINGSIENFGTISESGPFGAAIQILPSTAGLAQTITGSVVNETGGKLTGGVGIAVLAFIDPSTSVTIQHDVVNNGTITAGLTGIQVLSSTIGGAVKNGGTINAGEYGIQLSNLNKTPGGSSLGAAGRTTITGGVTNSGTITSTGTGFAGILLNGASVSNGITNTNTGSINATNGVGILVSNTGKVTFTGGTAFTNVGGASTVTGGITNSGQITAKTGIAVTGGSTVTGGITNTGIISGTTSAIDVTGEGAATTINQQGGTISGAILLSSLGDTVNVTGGVINGNITATGSSGTVNFAVGAGNNFIYTNTISGVSAVNVNSGTLYDNSSITATNVNVNSGGTLAPGAPNTIGTLAITGNLNFAAGSTYLVNFNPTTSSLTTVSGAAALSGATVDAVWASGSYISKKYTILNAGSISGTFGPLANFNFPANFTDNLSYDATHAYLNLVMAAPVVPGGLNTNQQNVDNGLINSFNVNGGIPIVFSSLTPAGLTQLSGEVGASFAQGAFQAGNMFLNLMLNPSFDGHFNTGGSSPIGYAEEKRPATDAFASVDRNKANSFDSRYGFWGAAFGGTANIDGNATTGSHDTNSQAYGFAAGLDYHATPDTILGFALGGGGTHWGLDQGLGSGRSDMFQAGVYAKTRWGAAYLSGALAYSFHDVTTDRTVTIAGTDMLEAKFKANMVSGRLEGGYRYAMPWVGVTPYAAVQVQSIALPSYGETATSGSAMFALNYASQTVTTTRTELGARFDKSYVLDRSTVLTLYSRAAWAHDFGNTASASAIFQSLPASNFTVNGAQPAPDGALLTAGAEYKLASGWSVLAKFDGEFSNTTALYSGTGVIRKVW
jgi:outer membrane autotransporter protein